MPGSLSPAAIQEALTNERLTHYMGQDGSSLVPFGPTSQRHAVDVIFRIEGDDATVLRASTHFGQSLAHVPREVLLLFVNQWNSTHRWPTAVAELDSATGPAIWGSASHSFGEGTDTGDVQRVARLFVLTSLALAAAAFSSLGGSWTFEDDELNSSLADGSDEL